jgi:hypothetical protein
MNLPITVDKFEDIKSGNQKPSINRRRTDSAKPKQKRTKGQTMIY